MYHARVSGRSCGECAYSWSFLRTQAAQGCRIEGTAARIRSLREIHVAGSSRLVAFELGVQQLRLWKPAGGAGNILGDCISPQDEPRSAWEHGRASLHGRSVCWVQSRRYCVCCVSSHRTKQQETGSRTP